MAIQIKRTISEQIYEQLRREIIDLEIKPGERLSIKELVQRFNVSQTPIKEALTKLSETGLLVTSPRTGYFAVLFTAEDIIDIYQLRELFEVFAISNGTYDASQLSSIKKKLQSVLKEKGARKRTALFYQSEEVFHSVIINGSGSARLRKFFAEIYDQVQICYHVARQIDRYTREHIGILDALIDGNRALASKLMQNHFRNARGEIVREFQKRLQQRD